MLSKLSMPTQGVAIIAQYCLSHPSIVSWTRVGRSWKLCASQLRVPSAYSLMSVSPSVCLKQCLLVQGCALISPWRYSLDATILGRAALFSCQHGLALACRSSYLASANSLRQTPVQYACLGVAAESRQLSQRPPLRAMAAPLVPAGPDH